MAGHAGESPFSLSHSHAAPADAAVRAPSNAIITGESDGARVGVYGFSPDNVGVWGTSDHDDGVYGYTQAAGRSGVFGESGAAENTNGVAGIARNGTGVYGEGKVAGFFVGPVQVNGDATLNGNVTVGDPNLRKDVHVFGVLTAEVDIVVGADCAEEFDLAPIDDADPGTVMVLNQDGALQPSQHAYDKKVAGVVSGAGAYKPGLILGKRASSEGRTLVALVGKVYCKVDAQYAAIGVGDLLTTSATPGHAMKADDPLKAFGAVIGKALRPLHAGQGLIPILIALQ